MKKPSFVDLKKETVELRLKKGITNRNQRDRERATKREGLREKERWREKRNGDGCIIEWLSFNKAPLTLHCSSPIFSSTDVFRTLLLSDKPLFSSTRNNVTMTHRKFKPILP